MSLVLPLAAVGCAQEDEPAGPPYVLGGLSVIPVDESYLCEGTVSLIEQEFARVENALGLTAQMPLTAYLGESAASDCPNTDVVLGCAQFDTEGVTIRAPITDIFAHEVAHAVRLSSDIWGTSVIEEGYAEAVAVGGLPPAPRLPIDPQTVSPGPVVSVRDGLGHADFDYSMAGSFVEWLRTAHGDTPLRSFTTSSAFSGTASERSPDGIMASFESAFGLSLTDAESSWRQQGLPQVAIPQYVPLPQQPWDDGVHVRDALDCRSALVRGPSTQGGIEYGFFQIATRVPEAGAYRIDFGADPGLALEMTARCTPQDGAVPVQFQAFVVLAPGESTTAMLGACEWGIFVQGDLATGGAFEVDVEPSKPGS
ncbi:MAG: hypothetical protein K0V04_26175 [Deltaproteobacteria bacterium]|nr:hypothetical protein [Deltaproteobacteria bacterium]